MAEKMEKGSEEKRILELMKADEELEMDKKRWKKGESLSRS